MKVTTVEVISKTTVKKEIQKSRKVPTSILTIFLFIQFVIGYDFGFNDVLKREIRHCFKYYSRLMCFVTFVVFATPLVLRDSAILIYATIILLQFLGHGISLRIAKYTVYQFITDIRAIDISVRSKEKIGGVIACVFCFSYCTFNLAVRFTLCAIANNGCGVMDNWRLQMLYDVFLSCLDIVHVVQGLVNYYTYCAVKYLKHLVDNRKCNIKYIRNQFMYIADCCDKIRPLYGHLVSDF